MADPRPPATLTTAGPAASTEPDAYGAFVDRSSDVGSHKGPLAGLRVAVKDNIAVKGLAWTAGLPLLAGRKADHDAPSVDRMRKAGAAIIGTTVTDAAGFGMMTPGVVNPYAPAYSAGGSSGGSAAAVAGGLADIGLGTDTGGSVRVPAACCGLFGLKPTFGRVPLDGVTPLSRSFDHVGLMARDLDTMVLGASALLSRALAGAEPPRRIGFDPGRLSRAHPAIRSAVEETLARLSADGHALVEIALPDPLSLAEVHGAIVCAEALEIWHEHWPTRSGLFAEPARIGLTYAGTLDSETIAEALSALPAVRRLIAACFEEAEAIVGPTIPVPTPQVGARTAHYLGAGVPVVFALLTETCPFNVSGNPALSIPLGVPGAGGIPVALQIAARLDGEAAALTLATLIAESSASA